MANQCQFCHRNTTVELEPVLGLASARACPECASQLRDLMRVITAGAQARLVAEKAQMAARSREFFSTSTR